MERNGDTVVLTLAGSPGSRPWEGCINSVNYRAPRGVPVELPRAVAEHVMKTEAEAREAARRAERLAMHSR